MRLSQAASLIFLVLGVVSAGNLRNQDHYMAKFLSWSTKFNKTFETNEEFLKRLQIFSQNEDKIESHNAKNLSWKLGHNQFSDLTAEEFSEYTGLNNQLPQSFLDRGNGVNPVHQPSTDLPDAVDWETYGAVTPVKNQGYCGSCWSFSATGALEGAYFLKNQNLLSFSEQQLVSCDTTDAGCNGGWMDNAFAWIQSNNGICTEGDYPYASGSGVSPSCETSCTVVDGSAPTSWYDVSESEDDLKSAVALQPVSVAIEADQADFQLYSSGVFTGDCGTNLDHGVLTVGYGTDSGLDYWKVKNSWSNTWGEAGYIRLQRGKNQEGGQCGILMAPSYPSL